MSASSPGKLWVFLGKGPHLMHFPVLNASIMPGISEAYSVNVHYMNIHEIIPIQANI